MRFILGGLVILFMVALAVGALTGRVRARNCCSMSADPADLRLRGAREPHDEPATPPRSPA